MNDKKKVVVTTPVGRSAYNYIAEPDTGREFSDDKYKLNVIWDKGEDLSQLESACVDAAKEKWGDDVDLTKIDLPFRDGDEKEGKGSEVFKGSWYINPKSKFPIKCFGPTNKEIGPELVYAGCYVRAKVVPHAYQAGRNKGVTFFINGLQFVKHGEKLGGGGETDTGFEEIAGDDPLEEIFG